MQHFRLLYVIAVLACLLVVGSASVAAAGAGQDANPPANAPGSRTTGQDVTTEGHPNVVPIGRPRDPQEPALPEAPVTALLPVICVIAAVGTLYAINARHRSHRSIAE